MIDTTKFKYANHLGFTDIEPYEIVKVVSDKTLEIRPMKCTRNFKPEFVRGGFSAICVNVGNQEWIIEPSEESPTFKIRQRKDGYFYKGSMRFSIDTKPSKYYDYNF